MVVLGKTPPHTHTHSGIGYQLEGLSDEVAFEHRDVRQSYERNASQTVGIASVKCKVHTWCVRRADYIQYSIAGSVGAAPRLPGFKFLPCLFLPV